jgi:2-dehydro-3-deoxygluconokinase
MTHVDPLGRAAHTAILAIGEPMLEFHQRSGAGDPLYLQGFGGDTSNFAVAAARQGASVGLLTRLGGDPFGDRLLDLWQREGIDVSSVERDADAPTGIYFVSHDARGHQFSYYRSGSAASRLRPQDLPLERIRALQLLHLSGISQAISTSACDAAFVAMAEARAAGVRVSYDPNIRLKLWPAARARAVVLESLALADIVLPSLEDAHALFGEREPDDLVDALLDRGAGLVALKLGAEGAIVADGAVRTRIPGRQVASVDATGAGDTFDGAFVSELLRGVAPVAAAHYANAAAALSTCGYGAVAPIPRRAEVEAFLAARG